MRNYGTAQHAPPAGTVRLDPHRENSAKIFQRLAKLPFSFMLSVLLRG
jgi:hypothetical protein